MRLVEYDARNFLDRNSFKGNEKKKCVKNGFQFGMLEYFGQEFWLKKDEDYTDKDFIKAVYELNDQTDKMKETELLSNLSRFLCGYAASVDCRKEVENLPREKRHNYFQNQAMNVDFMVTN